MPRPGAVTVTATASDPDGATSAPTTFAMTVNAQAATTTTTTSGSSATSTTTTTSGSSATSTTASTPGSSATSTTRLGATNQPDESSLPSTGGDLDAMLLIGLALMLGGAAVVLASQRRSRPTGAASDC